MDDLQKTLLEEARSYVAQGDRAGALNRLNQLVDVAAPDPDLLLQAAFGAFQLGNRDLAERLLRQVIDLRPDMAPAHNNLGNVLQAKGQLAEAVSAFQQCLEITPNDPMAYKNLGGVLEEMRRPDEAETAYRNALELVPENPALHEALGRALEKQARPDEALAAYNAALRIDSTYAPAHVSIGTLLQKIRRLDDSEAAYRRALEIDPRNSPARQNLAVLLHETGQLEEAEKNLRQVVQELPSDPWSPINLAKVLFDRRALTHALAACDMALERSPGHCAALAFKAICLSEAGDKDGAAFLTDMDLLVIRSELAVPEGYGSRAAFNAALFDQVAAVPSRFSEPGTDTVRQTQNLIFGSTGPLSQLLSMFDLAVDRYIETQLTLDHPFMSVRPTNWRMVESWATILREVRPGEDTHNHQAAWLSGVYYVRTPDEIDPNGGISGWIEFGRPPKDIKHSFEPEITVFPPREGVLILFPAYFYHRVLPFSAKNHRMSIAFDIVPS